MVYMTPRRPRSAVPLATATVLAGTPSSPRAGGRPPSSSQQRGHQARPRQSARFMWEPKEYRRLHPTQLECSPSLAVARAARLASGVPRRFHSSRVSGVFGTLEARKQAVRDLGRRETAVLDATRMERYTVQARMLAARAVAPSPAGLTLTEQELTREYEGRLMALQESAFIPGGSSMPAPCPSPDSFAAWSSRHPSPAPSSERRATHCDEGDEACAVCIECGIRHETDRSRPHYRPCETHMSVGVGGEAAKALATPVHADGEVLTTVALLATSGGEAAPSSSSSSARSSTLEGAEGRQPTVVFVAPPFRLGSPRSYAPQADHPAHSYSSNVGGENNPVTLRVAEARAGAATKAATKAATASVLGEEGAAMFGRAARRSGSPPGGGGGYRGGAKGGGSDSQLEPWRPPSPNASTVPLPRNLTSPL